MIVPIFLPSSPSAPARCPHCGKALPSDGPGGLGVALGVALSVLLAAVAAWGLFVLLEWLTGYRDLSLATIVTEHWRWLASRRVW